MLRRFRVLPVCRPSSRRYTVRLRSAPSRVKVSLPKRWQGRASPIVVTIVKLSLVASSFIETVSRKRGSTGQ